VEDAVEEVDKGQIKRRVVLVGGLVQRQDLQQRRCYTQKKKDEEG